MGTTGNTEKTFYTASKSRSEGRSGWAVTFRHPMRKDAKGKQGLKVRRGLGTPENAEADRMIEQMNELLSNDEWWSLGRREEAERRFSQPIVSAFYDAIEEGKFDSRLVRDQELPLPTQDDGYARVLFVGTTGAGKTTLLRHLIGSHPEKDRFPSTSTAKTTISDMEIVLGGTDFRAVITFFPENATRTAILECVTDAGTAVVNAAPDEIIADRLLNHRDQKFRFSYILGAWKPDHGSENEDDWDFGANDSVTEFVEESGADANSRVELQAALETYVGRVKVLATRTLEKVNAGLGQDITSLEGNDKDAAFSIFEDEFQSDQEFDELIADLLEAILARFESLSMIGQMHSRRSGWPEKWVFKTEDRAEFISTIKFFSSNAASSFGRLLTPLVDGVRVMGPFFPTFTDKQPRAVFVDGQGLGHTPDVSGAISTHITEQFKEADVILLVDNAQNPVQSSPLSVLRFVATGGYESKLAIAFTHFDQVRGINLPTFKDKRNHVLGSLQNGLVSLRSVVGSAITALEAKIYDRSFVLGAIDQASDDLPKGPKQELNRMLELFAASVAPKVPQRITPAYDTAGLMYAVQTAADEFHRLWNARLGFTWVNGLDKEHWTRVKALSRRLALQTDIEYDSLRPVADLVLRLQEAISRFLDNPTGWSSPPQTPEEAAEAISGIRQQVSESLHNLLRSRVADLHVREWLSAFDESGRGSAGRRANWMKLIYDEAAPVPGVAITESASRFLDDIRRLVHTAIEASGGEVKVSYSTRTA
jgi:energy-coupling factor transporter ATP-binding protein EcfA2